MNRWVQHASGKGDKWEVCEGEDVPYCYICIKDRISYALPKTEYLLCDPPEEWEDVTGSCEPGEFNLDQFFGEGQRSLNTTKYIVDHAHGGANVIASQRYRLRKIDGTHNGPAFVVERRKE